MYLTAEDPQFEDVREICQEIASYLKPYNTPYEIIEDRAQAVEKAITTAPSRRRHCPGSQGGRGISEGAGRICIL